MEPLRSTTARLRRTFAYPTDDSSTATNSPAALDEEEQESLIATLSAQNATRNAQFRRLLFALPALSAIPYLVSLLALDRPQSSLLALTSLASTAWLLYYLPPAETGIRYLDALGGGGPAGPAVRGGVVGGDEQEDDDGDIANLRRAQRRRRASSFSVAREAGFYRTPLERWLPYLNLGLCAVLFVLGILRRAKNGDSQSLIGDLLPGAVYAVVLAAKMVMGGVDPERELGGLRYEYKGA